MTQAQRLWLKALSAALLSAAALVMLRGVLNVQAREPIEPAWGTPAVGLTASYGIYEQTFQYTTPFSITDLRPEDRYANKESYELHSLTVYRPYTGGAWLQNRPVVFYIHGGAWVDGYAEWYTFTAKSLTGERGWVTVVIDYRLTSDQVFVADQYCPDRATCALAQNVPLRTKAAWYDDNLRDVAAAFTWVRDHIGAHGGDPRNIFVFGHSAGGHLATLLTTHPDLAALRPHVQGLISLSGAYNLSAFDDTPLEQVFWASTVSQTFQGGFDNAALLADASPFNYVTVSSTLPPVLLFYAQDEMLSLTQQAVFFDNLLTTHGHAHDTRYLTGYSHNSEMEAIEFITEPVTIELVNWIDAHLEYGVYLPLIQR